MAFSDRLSRQRDQHGDALRPWFEIERLTLDIRSQGDLDEVSQACWELLGPEPPKSSAGGDEDERPNATRQDWLDEVLRVRLLVTLANLAARKNDDPAQIDRLLNYLDQGIAANPEVDSWKIRKHQLLIALDRPKDLERDLREWTKAEKPLNAWRLSLGYLLAEQGEITEAIRMFEAVEAADELGPREYRTLADWYLVTDQRQPYERSLIEMYQVMQEWRLSNWLSEQLDPWQRREDVMPEELDENVLLVFRALFKKSGSPQNHLGQLQEFYRETRDFRLLDGLADAVVGHTPGKIYPFLSGMSSVISEVRDEATADTIVERLAMARQRAQTDVDHRALDLLEVMIERRGAELLNQPGPHVDQALTALQRAFQRTWAPGEQGLMADFLSGLGKISQQTLVDEQLRQLRILHEQAEKGTFDRLHIAHRRAETIWNYARHNEAIDLLWVGLVEYQQAEGGTLPVQARSALERFISYLEYRSRHTRGETVLLAQIQNPVNVQQAHWLKQRLYKLYRNALAVGGSVSLGSGQTLYENVERQLRGELKTRDQNHRYQLIRSLCGVYRLARDKKLDRVRENLRDFAFTQVPPLLHQQTTRYESVVSSVAATLRDVASPRDGVVFLVERIETEPKWFRLNNRDGWQQHGYQLADWRRQAKDLGDIELRLLKIVTDELRRDLESRNARNRHMYHDDHGYFWSEKKQEFARVAEQVLAQHKDSSDSVKYVAQYTYDGLSRHDRAIEILLDSHHRKILSEDGQWQLARYLYERHRFGEMVAILEPLVGRWPDNVTYRVNLMHAYFQTKQPERLLQMLEETDSYFHEDDRWNENVMAELARSCLQNQLYEPSTAYFEEAISTHQRTHPGRGIDGQTLSYYYRDLARAYTGLKRTDKAVDAACGAIVSWGPTHENRRNAIEELKNVLGAAPDLDHYVALLDKQSEESARENPIVRKALGQVYRDNRQYHQAIAQLKRAVESQPNDTETHQTLVACYDQLEDKEGAIQQLLASLQLTRRDIQLYQDLGNRYHELEQNDAAERAYTSIVEMLPSESESHTLLAEIRQQQDRWPEAVEHWKRVVTIRALEPTGLVKLGEAQVRLKQWDAARETIRALRSGTWPARFDDVDYEIRQLEQKIQRGIEPAVKEQDDHDDPFR